MSQKIPKLMSKRQLLLEAEGWREWWDKIGFAWYRDGEYPQDQRPPICQSEPVDISDIDEITSRQFADDPKAIYEGDYCNECGGPWGGHTRRCSKFPGYLGRGESPVKPVKPSICRVSGLTGELTPDPVLQQGIDEVKKPSRFRRFFEKLRACFANE